MESDLGPDIHMQVIDVGCHDTASTYVPVNFHIANSCLQRIDLLIIIKLILNITTRNF